jgi:adenylate kinase family enzyme
MRKIMVTGVSPGAGKSTFAKKLGKALNIEVYHLDRIYWKPNWVEATKEEFIVKNQEIVIKDSWIIEGNYSSTFQMREEHADTIIYLEMPLIVCLYRVFKRWIKHFGKTRPDMGEGCKEKLDYKFIKYILTTYRSRKIKMRNKLENFKQSNERTQVFILKGKKDIQKFLDSIISINHKNNM